MQYLGIDWGIRRAAWCALTRAGEVTEGTIPADEDGLARLVACLGPDVHVGDISRFPSARKLVGYAGLAPRIKQSGQSSRIGRLTKAGPDTLRWAAVEAAQQAWRPGNPGTSSTSTSSAATARPTPPRPPSRARS